jgi:hypothetical protein
MTLALADGGWPDSKINNVRPGALAKGLVKEFS